MIEPLMPDNLHNHMDETARQAMFNLDYQMDLLLIAGDREELNNLLETIHPHLGRLLANWRHPS